MKPVIRVFYSISLCLLGACYATAWAGAGPVVHIKHAEMLIHNGIPSASNIDETRLTGSWQPIELPHKFKQPLFQISGATSAMTSTWYRIRLNPLSPTPARTDLYLFRWRIAGQLSVYADGRQLYRSGESPAWNLFRRPALLLTLNQATEPPPKVLLFRIDSMPNTNIGFSSLLVGDSNALYYRYALREWLEYHIPFIGGSAFLATGFFALAVWLVRRHDYLYLLFFITALLSTIRRGYFFTDADRLPISDLWFNWLNFNTLNWQVVAYHFIVLLLHGQRHTWLNLYLIGSSLLVSVLTLPALSPMPTLVPIGPLLIFLTIVTSTIFTAFAWRDAWRSRSRDGLLFAAWFTAMLVFGINDWLRDNYTLNIEGLYLLPYGSIGVFLIFSHIVFRRYVGAITEVEQINLNLERHLKAREDELKESHRRLREIERRETLSKERRRLMQDMHDGIGSSLCAALCAVEKGHVDDSAIAEVLKDCIDDLKLAIDSMEPVEADLLLLLATLRFRLAPRLESAGIKLRWEVGDTPLLDWLDPRNALHILRILQESFTNIIKHTQATTICVGTAVEGSDLLVTIADNGQGFSLEKAKFHGGRGLTNQMHRANEIGAKISWASDNTGTNLILRLPIKRL